VGFSFALGKAGVVVPAHDDEGDFTIRPGPRACFSTLSDSRSKSILYGVFVWARGALNSQKRWFPPPPHPAVSHDPELEGSTGLELQLPEDNPWMAAESAEQVREARYL
jgi:hypothetical protein